MLWTAGQERMTRERNDRLVERFTAARDAALDVGVTTGRLTPKGTWNLPSYIPAPDPAQQARRGLAQLARDLGGQVAAGKEFPN